MSDVGRGVSGAGLKGSRVALGIAVLASLLLLSSTPAAASPPSGAFRFFHDPDGRLSAAIDPEGGTALYSWDAAGNLLSISRHESSELSIVQVSPGRAEVGDAVTIEGTGFSTTPSANTVKFNGTAATVTAATLTALSVEVPVGATSGSVTVATAAEGPVASPQSFTVTTASAPQISSISPTVAAAGEEVTISGSNFESAVGDNVVTVNGAQAQVASASSTSLKFLVPSTKLGGVVSLTTQEGSASGPDLFIPPVGAAASTVAATGRSSLGGSISAEVKEAGKVALVLIDGTAGQQASLLASEAGFAGEVRLYTPTGAELGGSPAFSKSSTAMIGPVTLPETGTYTVKLEGSGEATGTVKLSAYSFEDLSGSIAPTKEGATQAVSIATPGQMANYTVEVKAGEQVSVKTSSASFSGEYCVSWRNSEGANLASDCRGKTSSGFWQQQTFTPTPGTYTLRVDPIGPATGSVNLTAYDSTDLTGSTITPKTGEGESKTFPVEVPGQKNWIAFSGTAGQHVSLVPSEATFTGSFRVYAPSGSEVSGSSGSLSVIHGPFTLPETGTYKIKLEGSGEATGTVKLSAYSFEDLSGSIAPTKEGATQAVSIATPGQMANYTVEVKAGEQVSVKTSSASFSGEYCISWRTGSGSQLAQKCYTSGTGSGFWQQQTFSPTPGTYTLRVDPSSTATGSVTLTAYDSTDLTGATITPKSGEGESKTFPVEVPGQKNWIAFSGSKEQHVSLVATEAGFSGKVRIYTPAGAQLGGSPSFSTSTSAMIGPVTLPETGTYSIKLEGTAAEIGNVRLTAYIGTDVYGSIAPTKEGVTQPVSIPTVGQDGYFTVEVKSGQQVSVKTSSSTFNGEYCLSWLDSENHSLGSECWNKTGSGWWKQQSFPEAGTYTLKVNPIGSATGSVNLTAYDSTDLTGSTITPKSGEGESKTFPVEVPGQKNWVTFSGTAGQQVSLLASEAAFAGEYRVITPAGANLGSAPNFSKSATGFWGSNTLPETGTYRIELEGNAAETGTVKLSAYSFEDLSGSIAPTKEGATQAVSIATPGQMANYTVEVKAGEQVSVKTSSASFSGEYCISWRTGSGSQLAQKCYTSGTGSGFWQQQTFSPTPGTYTLRVDPSATATGSVTLTAYDSTNLTSTITPKTGGGESKTVSVEVPGQKNWVTFSGTAGQQVSLLASEAGFSGEYRVITPAGANLGSAPNFTKSATGFWGPTTLPETGTYKVELEGTGAEVGSLKLTAYLFEDLSGSIVPTKGGANQTATIATPGQMANYTVEVKAGQEVSVKTSSASFSGEYCISWRTGSGSQLSQKCYASGTGSGFWQQQSFSPTPGTYTLRVDPSSTATGSVTLTAYDSTDLTGSTITPKSGEGESKTFPVEVPGQKNWIAFSGTAGQEVSIVPSEAGSFSGSFEVLKPSGAKLSGSSGGLAEMHGPLTLPETGTYSIKLEGSGEATGTVKLTAYLFEDLSGSIAPTKAGANQTATIATPGQMANYTVEVKAGQQVSVKTSSSTFNGEYCISWRTSEGSSLGSKCQNKTSSGFWQQQTFTPTPGTYTLRVDPTATATGSVTLTAWDSTDLTGATITPKSGEGESKTLSVEVPGQKNWVTFSGTKSQLVTLKVTEPTFAGTMSIWAPSGSKVSGSEKSFSSGGSAKAEITPAETGTYKVKLEGSGEATGNLKLSAYLGSHVAWFGPSPDTAQLVSFSKPSGAPKPSYSDAPRKARRHAGRARRHTKAVEDASQPEQGSSLPRSVSSWRPQKRGAWLPPRSSFKRGWVVGQSPGPWTKIAPLQAAPGTTAVSGQVLRVDGMPLVGARIAVKRTASATRTDAAGRFLLAGIPSGHQILVIDGEAAPAKQRFGSFEAGVELPPHRTTVLDYTTWMTPLDRAGNHAIASPTRHETRITTPRIPGFEVRLPAGTVIRNAAGDPVKHLNITAIPVNRPAFPLPPFLSVPLYFTVQPGRAYLSKGARVIYPNWGNLPAGQRVDFWNYDPTDKGWHVYGRGEVTPDGKQVVPDPGVRVWQFTGAMVVSSPPPPAQAPPSVVLGTWLGDPVDLSTGLFVYQKTDLTLPGALPISIARTYRPGDSNSYSFGRGTTSLYDLRLWSTNSSKEADLILPDGGRVHFVRTSPGEGETDAVFEAARSPSVFSKAKITYASEGSGWDLKLTNGATFVFSPFLLAPLREIRDRYGNRLKITRSGENITQITSPQGRWVKFGYDSSGRVTEITDNGGRHFKYTYTSGDLTKVEAPEGRTTQYEYDASHRMKAIVNARGNKYLQIAYDANGRVEKQTMGDGGTFEFDYELDESGEVEAATVTDPLGNQREAHFNADGYMTSETVAPGTSLAETMAYERQPETGLVLSRTDALGHETEFEYDGSGNVTEVTKLAGTEDAVTTSLEYEPMTTNVTKLTDPLGHAAEYTYGAHGELLGRTDALGHETSFAYNSQGRPTSVTNAEGEETSFGYDNGDLVSKTDSLGRTTRRFVDSLGRVRAITSPGGHRTRYVYNEADDVTKVISPSGAETSFSYDADGNVTAIDDALGHETTRSYDAMDRLVSETDPLEHAETWTYDKAGDLVSEEDPNGETSTFSYDPLRRLSEAKYGVAGETADSSISYEYDPLNRLVGANDTASGEYTLGYDDLGRLVELSGPDGSVAYAYDDAGRRTALLASGLDPLAYEFDDANRLIHLSRGSQEVSLSYDKANRLAQVTLPDGITQSYEYDKAGEPVSIAYEGGEETPGAIDYAYDSDGLLEAMWGSYARLNLPQALKSTEYNSANELVKREGAILEYDNDGNLLSDGSKEYTWDSRGQLTAIAGSTSASFAYDPFGRRISKTLGGTTTELLYDGLNVVGESVEGETTASLITGLQPDQVFARTTGEGTSSFLTDRLGSTIALANEGGEISTSYTYDPFGAATSSGATSDNPYQFTGRENDGTGLQYNRARYYSPTDGRFVSQDPAGFEGSGTNLYGYASSDPLDYIDPTGEWPSLPDLGEVGQPSSSSESVGSQIGDFIGKMYEATSSLPSAEGLEPGRSRTKNIKQGTEEEVEEVWNEAKRKGKPVTPPPTYPGEEVELPDGTRVGRRDDSKSRGPAVEIEEPDGTETKIHVKYK